MKKATRKRLPTAKIETRIEEVKLTISELQTQCQEQHSLTEHPLLRELFPDKVAEFVTLSPLQSRVRGDLVQRDMSLDDFEVMESLQHTSIAKVSKARLRATGEVVVLKEQPVNDRFLRECNRLDKLNHPSVISLRGLFYTGPQTGCLVMPYYERGNLRAWVDEHAGQAEAMGEIRERLYEAFMAVAFLHQNGVLHADLKPENFLLSTEGHLVLTDLGSSRDLQAQFQATMTQASILGGTVAYSPPESFAEPGVWRRVPLAVDAFSLGVMLVELLAGERFSWNIVAKKLTNTQGEPLVFREGAGWELARALLVEEPRERLTVQEALLMPYFRAQKVEEGAVEGALATNYSSLSTFLISLRDPRAPSVTLPLGEAGVWPHFEGTELELWRCLRFETADFEVLTFAQVATEAIATLSAPGPADAPLLWNAERSVALPNPDAPFAWRALGRLVAKCIFEAVPVMLPFPPCVLQYMCTGDACLTLAAALDSLALWDPTAAQEYRAILARRLGAGSPDLCTHAHAGFSETEAVPLSDRTKRGVVQRWAKYTLVGVRLACLDELHQGFITAFPWAEHLQGMARFTDSFGCLLHTPLGPDAVLDKLTWLEAEEDAGRAVRGWFEAYLRSASSLVLQELVVRVTGRFDPAGVESILVSVSAEIRAVRMEPSSCLLVLPRCGAEAELHAALARVLRAAPHLHRTCAVCGEPFTEADGVTCGAEETHFMCQADLEGLVSSLRGDSTAELARRSAVLLCPEPECSAPRVVVQARLSGSVLSSFEALLQAVAEEKARQSLEPEIAERVEAEIARRAAQAAEARRQEDAQSEVWIRENTRPCPNCRTPILKNGGCLHMTCRNPQCGHGYWWCCMRPYTGERHNYYECQQTGMRASRP